MSILFVSELAGAFVSGVVSAAAGIFVVGRALVRRRLAGLLDLTSLSAKR